MNPTGETRRGPRSVWVPYDARSGLPAASERLRGRVLPIFAEEEYLLEPFRGDSQGDVEGRPLGSREVLGLCDEHAPNFDAYLWVSEEEHGWLTGDSAVGRDWLEPLPFWRLKAWA